MRAVQPSATYELPTEENVRAWGTHLMEEEASRATIEKYLREVRRFLRFLDERAARAECAGRIGGADQAGDAKRAARASQPARPESGGRLSKAAAVEFKAELEESYSPSTVNVAVAAINRFMSFLGIDDIRLRRMRMQQRVDRQPERYLTKAEYERLIAAAVRRGDDRARLLLQTLCATGIRVSELRFITVEASRRSMAQVNNKGKVREVWIPASLASELLEYARRMGVKTGPVLRSARGNPLDRTNVWRIMKTLAVLAGVESSKVYPHNLRHLFAETYYGLYHDLDALSWILGHTSVETTRIYVATTGAEREQRIAALGLLGSPAACDRPSASDRLSARGRPKPEHRHRSSSSACRK